MGRGPAACPFARNDPLWREATDDLALELAWSLWDELEVRGVVSAGITKWSIDPEPTCMSPGFSRPHANASGRVPAGDSSLGLELIGGCQWSRLAGAWA